MDRLFLDANVLFSAAYGNPDFKILWKRAGDGACLLLASPYVVEEVRRNLKDTGNLEALLERVTLTPDPFPTPECPVALPSKDRPVLMAAIAAGATHLLTGDRKDFGAYYRKRVLGVLILPPADYLAESMERVREKTGAYSTVADPIEAIRGSGKGEGLLKTLLEERRKDREREDKPRRG